MTSGETPILLTPELFSIGRAVAGAGGRPILVGGTVRDGLLGYPHSKDFDVEVFGLALRKLQKVLAAFGPVHAVGRHFGVLKLATPTAEYDVSVPRRESKIGKGHRGFHVTPDPGMTFEDAAARRDFTMNSMGYAFLERRLLDPFQGRRDLAARVLRHVGPAFAEDPLRVLRAMQFAGRFTLTIAPETIGLCRALDLHELPRERTWEEFKKLLLAAPAPSVGFAYAEPLGILRYFPELAALQAAPPPGSERLSPWERTMRAVDAAARLRSGVQAQDLVLLAAALCHELGSAAGHHDRAGQPLEHSAAAEAPTRQLLARMTNEEGFIKAVAALILELPWPGLLYARRGGGTDATADAAVRRLAVRISLPRLLELAEAQHRAIGDASGDASTAEGPYPAGAWLRERAQALGVWEGPPQPLLRGRHLLELGMRQGPELGDLLQQAFELQLDGGLATLEQALAWARARRTAAATPPGDAPP
ncbi:MAG: CCA tRNA nucleotidyltransferase [Candidatus Lambdaproteobacteria bacterium]|nr:CCA tRNA nucleotidyltransferase [Candidatus Lambdaproteobacteria bacterium]